MSKPKLTYSCTQCGSLSPKWVGQCPDCGAWNSLTEVVATKSKSGAKHQNYAGASTAEIVSLQAVAATEQARVGSGLPELDRVLGGGLVPGSVILIGGDPGIGKSTVLLQALSNLSSTDKTLYITGEESQQQVALRAARLGLTQLEIPLLTETRIETILMAATQAKPAFMVIDSIQTIYSDAIPSAPGTVTQVRETTAELVRFAKLNQITIFLVGHVTKEGMLAGPRVLEHMVDTVLYFEAEADSRFRVIRAVKNRFGAVNELGIFAMTDKGLKEVNNPSAIFLTRNEVVTAGSVVMVTFEGTRPMLVEIQVLADDTHGDSCRRLAVGLDQNRLSMMLAVLNRHGGVLTARKDIFVNVVGGMKVTETGIDLPLVLAVVSSISDKSIHKNTVVFGEIGLAGEVRPVQAGQARLKEAQKLGFTRAVVPKLNVPKDKVPGLEIIPVTTIKQALDAILGG